MAYITSKYRFVGAKSFKIVWKYAGLPWKSPFFVGGSSGRKQEAVYHPDKFEPEWRDVEA